MADQVYAVESDQELINLLQEGLQALSIKVSEYQLGQLMGYISLIVRWNKTYNLTAIRDPKDMIVQHLFDAFAAIESVQLAIDQVQADTSSAPIGLDRFWCWCARCALRYINASYILDISRQQRQKSTIFTRSETAASFGSYECRGRTGG